MLWISSTAIIAYGVITGMGLLYVETEILRCGKENILDSLQEGVIILSEDTNEMHYLNKAARNICINTMSSEMEFANSSPNGENEFTNKVFKSMNQEILASIDSEIFGH